MISGHELGKPNGGFFRQNAQRAIPYKKCDLKVKMVGGQCSFAIPLNTLLAQRLRPWHAGIIVESTNVIPVHLTNARRLRKNIRGKNTLLSSSTKTVVRDSVREVRLKSPLDEKQVIVLEITKCHEMEIILATQIFTNFIA